MALELVTELEGEKDSSTYAEEELSAKQATAIAYAGMPSPRSSYSGRPSPINPLPAGADTVQFQSPWTIRIC